MDSVDFLTFLACFGDDEDLICPYCRASITITSNEGQVGLEAFQCCECSGTFTVNWDEGEVYYNTSF